MPVLVALTIGLVWWVCAWALGVKSFDAFMVTIAVMVLAATVYVFRPLVQDRLRGPNPDA